MDDKVKECEFCIKDNPNCYFKQNLALKEENEKMAKGYELLTEFISTRMLDDFTGYNEDVQGFDIVQAIKEIIEYQEQENTALKEKLKLAVEDMVVWM